MFYENAGTGVFVAGAEASEDLLCVNRKAKKI